jgi:hypothetical protein
MNPRFSIQWAPQWALCIWRSFLQSLWAQVLQSLTFQLEIRLLDCWYLEYHCEWNFLVVSRLFAILQAFGCKVWRSELYFRLPFRPSQRRVRLTRVSFEPRATTPSFWMHYPCICSNSLIIHCTSRQCNWRHDHAYLYIQSSKGDNSSYSRKSPSRNSRWICWVRSYIMAIISELHYQLL